MLTLLAMSEATKYTLAAIAIWFIGFPALITGLIAFAVAGTMRERTENEEERARRRRS